MAKCMDCGGRISEAIVLSWTKGEYEDAQTYIIGVFSTEALAAQALLQYNKIDSTALFHMHRNSVDYVDGKDYDRGYELFEIDCDAILLGASVCNVYIFNDDQPIEPTEAVFAKNNIKD